MIPSAYALHDQGSQFQMEVQRTVSNHTEQVTVTKKKRCSKAICTNQ
jgi:hypothetical protein